MKLRGALDSRVEGKPSLARTEIVDKTTRARLEAELGAALKRRPSHERRLAGALRTLAPLSAGLRVAMADATETFLRRGTLDRELYGACLRSLGETRDKSATPLLKRALALESAGGSPALSSACFSSDPALAPFLAKIAGGHKAHLAFAAETARVTRGESNGAHLMSLAPMIKESHRLTLCAEIFLPLSRVGYAGGPPLRSLGTGVSAARNVGPALAVLRGAERHLGRWLVLAEVAAHAGDMSPLEEARARGSSGPSTARAAWSLVAWALADRLHQAAPHVSAAPGVPAARPTVEIVARLSDRPSADRDPTFLFRLARAKAPAARPMLEALVKELPLSNDVAVRAALFLARDHGRDDLTAALLEAASSERKEESRGIATAALWDLGLHDDARRLSGELVGSRSLANVVWAILIRAAAARGPRGASGLPEDEVMTETTFRWMQWGWLE